MTRIDECEANENILVCVLTGSLTVKVIEYNNGL